MTTVNTVPGWMTARECRHLRELFRRYDHPDTVGVEIGSAFGRSATEIAQAIPKGRLICIDRWGGEPVHNPPQLGLTHLPPHGMPRTLAQFRRHTGHLPNIEALQADRAGQLVTCPDRVAFLFLDAAHQNPWDRDYLDFWLPRLGPGGRLAGHDYLPQRPDRYPDVLANVHYLEDRLGLRVQNTVDTIWYFDL